MTETTELDALVIAMSAHAAELREKRSPEQNILANEVLFWRDALREAISRAKEAQEARE